VSPQNQPRHFSPQNARRETHSEEKLKGGSKEIGPLIAILLGARSRSADRHPAGCKEVGPVIAILLDARK
jgi:hypothetical protein